MSRPATASLPRAKPGPAFIVWFTGLPASGKTTLAHGLQAALAGHQRAVVLDGDALREQLSPELGFSPEDRSIHVQRVASVARLLARQGVPALVAVIAPYAVGREQARRLADADGVPFLLVFVDAPIEVLRDRDPKGLYCRAAAGTLGNLTGVSAPYETPVTPDVTINTARETVSEGVGRIWAELVQRSLIYRGQEAPRAGP